MSENVTVITGGTPTLASQRRRHRHLRRRLRHHALTFNYTVGGESTIMLASLSATAINLNGATIRIAPATPPTCR